MNSVERGPISLWVASDLGEVWLALMEGDRPYELILRNEEHTRLLGAIFKGRVSGQARAVGASFVEIGGVRDAFLMDGRANEADPPALGEELLIQIVREADGGKGPRATRHLTLAGWSLVFAPVGPSGVSRRIDDIVERERLKGILDALAPEGTGLIARTSAAGATREELEQERDELVERWNMVSTKAAGMRAPALVHRDEDPALSWLRDHLALAPVRIVVDGPGSEDRKQALQRVAGLPPIETFSGPLPAVEAMHLDRELSGALSAHVPLPSGGRLIIESTEALTAIDVNSGSDFTSTTLEETATRTNLEAIPEIVRQILLRDLAGMVLIDFIDMMRGENRARVDEALAMELTRDRSKLRTLPLTDFCLAQITRQRRRPSLARLMLQPCSCCRRGHVLRPETQARQLLRQLRTMARPRPLGRFTFAAPQPVLEAAREIVEKWGQACGLPASSQISYAIGEIDLAVKR